MGRHAYPLTRGAIAEIRRLVRRGKRTHAIAGAPSTPSYRDIAARLRELKLTPSRVDPKVLWRACKRLGITLPPRRARADEARS
jgi:hypothetical protein